MMSTTVFFSRKKMILVIMAITLFAILISANRHVSASSFQTTTTMSLPPSIIPWNTPQESIQVWHTYPCLDTLNTLPNTQIVHTTHFFVPGPTIDTMYSIGETTYVSIGTDPPSATVSGIITRTYWDITEYIKTKHVRTTTVSGTTIYIATVIKAQVSEIALPPEEFLTDLVNHLKNSIRNILKITHDPSIATDDRHRKRKSRRKYGGHF